MLDNEAPMPPMDAPIPGQGMTAPLGDRPWQNPPRFTTVEQATEFYVPKITDPRQSSQILDMLEMGVSVDTLVDTLQLGGVMEGLHTVDVGLLVTPILAEVVAYMADGAEIEYTMVTEAVDSNKPTDTEISLAIKESATQAGATAAGVAEEMPMQVEEDIVMEEEPKGLMARRPTDGV